jgi:DNA-binding MarR family transcriptional regulator
LNSIDNTLFRMSHKELELLVVDFKMTRDIVTDVYERYLIYEALRRSIDDQEPFNLKWIQSTLKLSFPKVQNIVNNLLESGYFTKERSYKDKRVTFLLPTKKLIQGLLLFEEMKMNELFLQKITVSKVKGKPALSELTLESKEIFKKLHLDEFF